MNKQIADNATPTGKVNQERKMTSVDNATPTGKFNQDSTRTQKSSSKKFFIKTPISKDKKINDKFVNTNSPINENQDEFIDIPPKINFVVEPEPNVIDPGGQIEQSEIWNCSSKQCLIYFSQLFIVVTILIISSVNLSISPESSSSNIWASLIGACLGYVMPAPSLKKEPEK
jgi:hypothetical protein